MTKIFLSLLFIFTTVLSSASIDESKVAELWNGAATTYAEGDYEKAIEIYKTLEREQGVSASLYYNLANSYFKNNNLANAIINFNRALKLEPTNRDVIYNLSVANALTTNKIKEIPKFFVVRWVESIRNIMSSDAWANISIIGLAIFLALAVSFLLSRNSGTRKSSFTLGIVVLCVTIISAIASTTQMSAQSNDTYSIVMQNNVAVKSSPDAAGKDIFILDEGVKVNVVENLGKWSKIIIASGDTGWVETLNIEKI